MIMIDLFAMLGSILLAILAAGLGLAGHSIKDHPLDLQALAGQIPTEDAYRPMARLFAQADLEFLRNQPGGKAGMERRLTLQRRRVLSIYLRQIRGDFHQMWNQCCPGKVAPSDGKSRPLNVLWPVLPGNDLKSRGRKWSPERSIRTRHNEG